MAEDPLQVLPTHWPWRHKSVFIETEDLCWHVQRIGVGPPILLLHGTGASTHSWSGICNLLLDRYECIAVDLPGQGFSGSLPGSVTRLPEISVRLSNLMSVLDVTPSLIVGHSAGAAIAVHMASQQLCAASGILSINGAFEPFGSIAAPIFTRAAAWLAGNPFIQHTTSLHGYFQRPIRKLLEETGSQPSPEMIRAYQTLIRKPEHVAGTLKMMAGWDLTDMTEWLAQLDIPLWLAAASGDKTVSPEQSKRAARASPQGEFMAIPRLGHLAHEERPEYFASLIERLFARTQ